MKRFGAIIAVLLIFTSCAAGQKSDIIESEDHTSAENEYKHTLQLGVVQGRDSEKGKIEFSSTYCAIICDGEGKIVSCAFDATEDKVKAENGRLDPSAEHLSKRAQGNDYGMRSASGIGKEWFEQADHFADTIKGYTVAEALEIDEGDADLRAGCTIDIDGFKEAIRASEKDTMKKEFVFRGDAEAALAAVANDEGSSNATGSGDGVAAMAYTYAAAAMDGERMISSRLEATETKVFFDGAGNITETSHGPGKREQGISYGMKPASKIEKEWFEQADAFEDYTVGMNGEQVAAIATNGGRASDRELASGCTVKVNDFIIAVSRAANMER